jgi:hypothetical protein
MSRIETGVVASVAVLALLVAAICFWPERWNENAESTSTGSFARESATTQGRSTSAAGKLKAWSSSSSQGSESASADLARRSTSASDPQERATALAALTLARDNETLEALAEASRHDAVSGNRAIAVESLRQLAANGGDMDGSIRARLKAAMDDPDSTVAQHAREAFQEVTTSVFASY